MGWALSPTIQQLLVVFINTSKVNLNNTNSRHMSSILGDQMSCLVCSVIMIIIIKQHLLVPYETPQGALQNIM